MLPTLYFHFQQHFFEKVLSTQYTTYFHSTRSPFLLFFSDLNSVCRGLRITAIIYCEAFIPWPGLALKGLPESLQSRDNCRANRDEEQPRQPLRGTQAEGTPATGTPRFWRLRGGGGGGEVPRQAGQARHNRRPWWDREAPADTMPKSFQRG